MVERKEILNPLWIHTDKYKRDRKIITKEGIVNLHPTKGTQKVSCKNHKINKFFEWMPTTETNNRFYHQEKKKKCLNKWSPEEKVSAMPIVYIILT